MIAVSMSAVIGAKRERVWRSLTEPEEMLGWDEHIIGPLGDLSGYPEVGQRIRWRYRLGPFLRSCFLGPLLEFLLESSSASSTTGEL